MHAIGSILQVGTTPASGAAPTHPEAARFPLLRLIQPHWPSPDLAVHAPPAVPILQALLLVLVLAHALQEPRHMQHLAGIRLHGAPIHCI